MIFKNAIILFGLLFLTLLSSCSYDTKNNFQSEINQPVKNKGDYTRIGDGFDYFLKNGTELDSIEAVYLNEVDIWSDV